jgi:signal peptidase
VRGAVLLARWTAIGLGAGLLAALLVPFALHMRPLVVLTGSMEPVLHPGDVTVVQRIDPADARVGDVVTFKAPETGRLTTHRVRSVHREGARFAFATKGDANHSVERWSVRADGRMSRAVFRLPWIGHAVLRMRTPLGWTLLVGLPLLVLAGQELRRTWRTPEVTDAATV